MTSPSLKKPPITVRITPTAVTRVDLAGSRGEALAFRFGIASIMGACLLAVCLFAAATAKAQQLTSRDTAQISDGPRFPSRILPRTDLQGWTRPRNLSDSTGDLRWVNPRRSKTPRLTEVPPAYRVGARPLSAASRHNHVRVVNHELPADTETSVGRTAARSRMSLQADSDDLNSVFSDLQDLLPEDEALQDQQLVEPNDNLDTLDLPELETRDPAVDLDDATYDELPDLGIDPSDIPDADVPELDLETDSDTAPPPLNDDLEPSTDDGPAPFEFSPTPADSPGFFDDEPADDEILSIFNDRDFLRQQRAFESAWEELRRRPISTISLDITPSIEPNGSSEEVADAMGFNLSKAPARVWRDRKGRALAVGRLKNFKHGRVFVTTDDGVDELSWYDLSNEDLVFVSAWWELPSEFSPSVEQYQERDWTMTTFTWTASALCHKPLYFEEVQLERYGHSAGPFKQAALSGVHFFGNIFFLPYRMGHT